MRIARRLFVVPLANNNHGKTSIIRALVSQGEGYHYVSPHPHKSVRTLFSPRGRKINSYIFGRSYQETEKLFYNSVIDALDGNDPLWRSRELIIMPSHTGDIKDKRHTVDDIDQMIDAAHRGGFDIIVASIVFNKNNLDNELELFDTKMFEDIWLKNWDERWTLPNKWFDNAKKGNPYLEGQLSAIGRDLWFWIADALAE